MAYPVYEYCDEANIYPMLPEDELRDLAADIQEQGLLRKIALYRTSPEEPYKIIDGRNRYIAITKYVDSGERTFAPEEMFFHPEVRSPIHYVLSCEKRRHLTKEERLEAAMRAKPLLEAEIAAKEADRKSRQAVIARDAKRAEQARLAFEAETEKARVASEAERIEAEKKLAEELVNKATTPDEKAKASWEAAGRVRAAEQEAAERAKEAIKARAARDIQAATEAAEKLAAFKADVEAKKRDALAEAAKMLDVSPASLARFQYAMEHGCEKLIEALKSRKIGVMPAYAIAKEHPLEHGPAGQEAALAELLKPKDQGGGAPVQDRIVETAEWLLEKLDKRDTPALVSYLEVCNCSTKKLGAMLSAVAKANGVKK